MLEMLFRSPLTDVISESALTEIHSADIRPRLRVATVASAQVIIQQHRVTLGIAFVIVRCRQSRIAQKGRRRRQRQACDSRERGEEHSSMSQMVQEQLHPARVCVRICVVEVAGKDPGFLRDPMPQFSIPLYSRSRRRGKGQVCS